MKKIDLHLHTVSTISDSHFVFSIDKLEEYVGVASIDAIAITNHNVFDLSQYKTIRDRLEIAVFPGIEIDLEGGHVLLVTDDHNADRLHGCSDKVTGLIRSPGDDITHEQLLAIFGDLRDFLVIPHYEKKPSIQIETLDKLKGYVTAGEVDSAKKFIRCAKDHSCLTPVLFSDARMKDDLQHMPTRATFVDCGEITLSALRHCLSDRRKVALSEGDGNESIQVLDTGLSISTGLNVLLGDRSSGKTYTLDRMSEQHPDAKYIRQFSLVQVDERKCEQNFNADIERRKSFFAEEYLSRFKSLVEEVSRINLKSDDDLVQRYLETLIESARNADRQDVFSRAKFFNESTFKMGENTSLKSLIQAVRHLIENVDYRDVISLHIEITGLKSLACELIETLWDNERNRLKWSIVNEVVLDIKRGLGVRSSAIQVEDVDLYEVTINQKKVERFEKVVKALQVPVTLRKEAMQGFKILAKRTPFSGAQDLKTASGTKAAFSPAWKANGSPYQFLLEISSIEVIPESEWYKYFVKVEYDVMNRDGFPVSGGERSEFRLLQEITDAQSHSMLLLDEPESSFDNTFLNSNVNSLIRDISKTMPVIVVTHNSTVGASIGADYLLYARKEISGKKIDYKMYFGHPSDKMLKCHDGSEISNHHVLMNSLEAGVDAYQSRRRAYETLEG